MTENLIPTVYLIPDTLFLQLKYQNSEEETNDDEELTNLESVRVLEGVALQHGFVGRLVHCIWLPSSSFILLKKDIYQM